MNIILASSSPRRRTLMRQAGIPCTVMPCDADETVSETLSPAEAVGVIAERKASRALEMLNEMAEGPEYKKPLIIVAADTVVSIDGVILGKPRDKRGAFNMLKTLQGRKHTVYTGVAVIKAASDGETRRAFVDAADVYFRPLTDAEIRAYAATGEPLDKAGAYGAQGKGALLIERIDGDFHTVIGLPLVRLYLALKELGFDALTEE